MSFVQSVDIRFLNFCAGAISLLLGASGGGVARIFLMRLGADTRILINHKIEVSC